MKANQCLAATALVLCLFLQPSASTAEPPVSDAKPAQVQWEHCAFTHDLRGAQTNADVAREIVRLGKEGWELVSVANFAESGTTTKTVYYFKRRL